MPRPARLARALAILLLVAAVVLAQGARPGAAAAEFMALADIKPGQRAVGRTVFIGRTIEEFELEIVGVVPGGRTEGAMILARGKGTRIEHDGIAAGMSGSPIYVDGKLIGALAFGWPFSRDALCGIQPIADMLEVMRHPDGKPAGGFDDGPAAPAEPSLPFPGVPTPTPPGAARSRVPLVAGGFDPSALALLSPWAAEHGFLLVPGGGGGDARATLSSGVPRLAAREALAALEPGAAVAVDLMRGDLNLSAIGTLTYREGDRVVAFGHPFFQTGNVAYPLSLAEVTTIVASNLNSFKMGTPTEQVGTITQDRRAAVAGRVGPIPRMLPLVVRVKSGADFATASAAPADAYRFDLVRHRLLAPQLAGIAAVNALATAAGTVPEATWRYRLSLTLPGGKPLVLEDTATGVLQAASTQLSGPLGLLLDNPFAPFDAESLALDVTVLSGASRAQVWAARIEPTVARPGDEVRVIATLRDFRGGQHDVIVPLVVPEDAADGRLVVAVGGGGALDRQEALRLPGRHRAVSLASLLDRLADRRRDDHVYAALYGPGLEPTVDGVAYPDLPGFAQRMMAADRATRPGDPWGRLAPLAERGRDVAAPVAGLLTVPLEVRRRPLAPFTARSSDRASTPSMRVVDDGDEETP
ncbi:MAG: SpoIVB peptidase S55 domain-containing protein [Candidatus Eisenbacteria bacterium]